MIEMPTRSITRFFVPMIDVLLLLFCVYLLLPLAKGENDLSPEAKLLELESRNAELEAALQGKPLTAAERLELERLRKAAGEGLGKRLRPRVLEVDRDGKLFYRGGPRDAVVFVKSRDDARRLIDSDREKIEPGQELFYVIVGTRSRPTGEEFATFETWFGGAALGLVQSASGIGGKP